MALLLFAATAAFGQATPTISDFSRTQGSVGGGDVVLIRADNLPYCDVAACPFVVSFGGVPARSTGQMSSNLLRVITPAHAPGNVEVTLSVGKTVVATSPYKFRFAGLLDIAAPDIFNYETLLIPIAVGSGTPVEGAFGSRWTTDLWVSNSGDADVEFFNGYPTCPSSTPGCLGARFPVITAHSSRMITFPADVTSAGYLFYVQKGGAENIHVSLRVRDVSRSEENAGTELPLFRVSSSQPTPSATVLNLPVGDVSRTSLRVYTDSALPLRLRIFRMADDALVVDQDIQVVPADQKPYGETHGFPARSEYAQIGDLAATFSEIAADAYRVEVTSTGSWVWVLATVTNNRTQLVTAISSQPVQHYGVIRE